MLETFPFSLLIILLPLFYFYVFSGSMYCPQRLKPNSSNLRWLQGTCCLYQASTVLQHSAQESLHFWELSEPELRELWAFVWLANDQHLGSQCCMFLAYTVTPTVELSTLDNHAPYHF